MSFCSVLDGKADTAHYIDFVCYGLNMNRIYTVMDSAKMVAVQFARRDNLYEQLIGDTVCVSRLAFPVDSRIPRSAVNTSRPQPTWNTLVRNSRVYLDFAKEANEKFTVYGKSVRIALHGLFSLKLDRLCMATSGVASRVAFLF